MPLPTLSKCLEPEDYKRMECAQEHLEGTREVLLAAVYRFEHHHRLWEYGMGIESAWELRKNKDSNKEYTVLDVGGGGSIFGPSLALLGFEVTVVDPQPVGEMIRSQHQQSGVQIEFSQQDFMQYPGGVFDAVTCISVIEHIPADTTFFEKMLRHVRFGGILFLTTDFSTSGEPKTVHHLRTYNEPRLNLLLDLAMLEGFTLLGGEPYWEDTGKHVNGYNFCSLALKRS